MVDIYTVKIGGKYHKVIMQEDYAKLEAENAAIQPEVDKLIHALESIAYFKESLCSFGDEGKVIELAEKALAEYNRVKE